MGLDIRIRIERFDEGKWVRVPYAVQPWYTREKAKSGSGFFCSRDEWAKHDAAVSGGSVSTPEVFDARNYGWFSLLADVRGEVWDNPIAAGRGIPEGASYEIDTSYLHDYLGDHSFTWVSLEELEAYPWDTTFQGELSARDASSDWPGQVLPILRTISNGQPLRLLMGFDS